MPTGADVVKVTNTHSTKPLVLNHDGLGHITLAPGQEKFLPLEYALINFGNPGAANIGRHTVRDNDYASIRTLWGFYPGMMPEADWPGMMPSFTVHDLDGKRIHMLIEDPDGIHSSSIAGARTDEHTDQAILTNRIGQLEAQLTQLTQALSALVPGTVLPIPEPTGTTQDDSVPPGGWPAVDTSETQGSRNEIRDDLPTPAAKPVAKDGPRTTRIGGR